MRIASKLQARNTQMRQEYSRLLAVKEYGKRKYTATWIIAKLAEQYFLSERTVQNIVFCAEMGNLSQVEQVSIGR